MTIEHIMMGNNFVLLGVNIWLLYLLTRPTNKREEYENDIEQKSLSIATLGEHNTDRNDQSHDVDDSESITDRFDERIAMLKEEIALSQTAQYLYDSIPADQLHPDVDNLPHSIIPESYNSNAPEEYAR